MVASGGQEAELPLSLSRMAVRWFYCIICVFFVFVLNSVIGANVFNGLTRGSSCILCLYIVGDSFLRSLYPRPFSFVIRVVDRNECGSFVSTELVFSYLPTSPWRPAHVCPSLGGHVWRVHGLLQSFHFLPFVLFARYIGSAFMANICIYLPNSWYDFQLNLLFQSIEYCMANAVTNSLFIYCLHLLIHYNGPRPDTRIRHFHGIDTPFPLREEKRCLWVWERLCSGTLNIWGSEEIK